MFRVSMGVVTTLILGIAFWGQISAYGVAAPPKISTESSVSDNPAVHPDDMKNVPPFSPNRLGKDVHQVVFVRAKANDKKSGALSAWEKSGDHWVVSLHNADVVLGWHGIVAPHDKFEGDGATPAGIYSLSRAFGYYPFPNTKLPYIQLTDNHYWVDDPLSALYNQLVAKKPDAQSFEKMKRTDSLYKVGIVVEYNTHPVVARKGSAIFLHIWRGAGSSTAGCVAMAEPNLIKLLEWLDPSQHPIIWLEKE